MLNPSPSWEIPADRLEMPDRAVHVWRASSHASPAHHVALSRLLSPDETTRSEAFYFERDCRCYVRARGLLRMLLGRYLDRDPAALRFGYGPFGKPELVLPDGAPALQFNVSHSGDVILIAITRGRRVGVDVERFRGLPDAVDLARRFFSQREWDAFVRLPPARQHASFFTCWTRKESFVKAIGEGLSHPLDAFDVPVEPETPARLLQTRADSAAAGQWRMCDLHPAPGYAAALAVEGRNWDLHCWQVPEDVAPFRPHAPVSSLAPREA